MKASTSFDRNGMVCLHSKQSNGSVVEASSKDSGRSFNMPAKRYGSELASTHNGELYAQSPTPILVGVVHEIPNHLQPLLECKAHVGDVTSNHNTREEEHRSTIFSGPVAIT